MPQLVNESHWSTRLSLKVNILSFCEERMNFCVFISSQDLTNSHRWVSWSASHRFMRRCGLLMSHSDLGCQFVWLNTRDYLTLGHTHCYGNPDQGPVTDSWIKKILLILNLCGPTVHPWMCVPVWTSTENTVCLCLSVSIMNVSERRIVRGHSTSKVAAYFLPH